MNKTVIILSTLAAMAAAVPASAHEHGGMDAHMDGGMHNGGQHPVQHDMKRGFMQTRQIDGYAVTFHIMKAPAGKMQGGSHHVMVKFEQDGHVLTDLVANSKANHPNGKSESKMLMQMGDWYMAAYDLGHKGPHQVMVLFKTADGAKHFGGIEFSDDGAQ